MEIPSRLSLTGSADTDYYTLINLPYRDLIRLPRINSHFAQIARRSVYQEIIKQKYNSFVDKVETLIYNNLIDLWRKSELSATPIGFYKNGELHEILKINVAPGYMPGVVLGYTLYSSGQRVTRTIIEQEAFNIIFDAVKERFRFTLHFVNYGSRDHEMTNLPNYYQLREFWMSMPFITADSFVNNIIIPLDVIITNLIREEIKNE